MTETKEESRALARPQKGTVLERLLAVASSPEERARAWALATKVEQSRAIAEIAEEVLGRSWGNAVAPALRAQAVRWALDQGADPITEVFILGGKPWLNALYYQRLVAAEPDFQHAEELWVNDDPRATDEERERRKQLRVKYNVPDEIAATVGLFREQREAAKDKPPIPVRAALILGLFFTARGPHYGIKWSPSRANDDVGLEHPEQSARTRAWRKAALQAVRRPSFSPRLKEAITAQALSDEVGKLAAPLGRAVSAEPASEPLEVIRGVPPKPEAHGEDAAAATTTHNPSAVCQREGPHPKSECGYNH